MKWMYSGRTAAAAVASLAMTAGLVSCTNTKLGYVFATSQENGGQIYSYRVDSNSGQLTQLSNKSSTQSSPVGSGGAMPTRLVLAEGGSFLYILNPGAPLPITLFTVGGDGTLFAQSSYATQGSNPQDIHLSADGGYLYVADKNAPDPSYCPEGLKNCGDITVLAIDAGTGRLSPVQNTTCAQNCSTNPISYFPVGYNPIRIYTSGSYVYTLDNNADGGAGKSGSEIYTYFQQPGSSSQAGQLTLTENTNPTSFVGPNPTAVNGTGAVMYVTDGTDNDVYQYTIANGTPQALSGGGVVNPICLGLTSGNSSAPPCVNPGSGLAIGTGPTDLMVDPTNKYLFVTAAGNNQLVGFTLIQSGGGTSGALQYNPTNGATNTSSGSGPQCLAITGGREFLYTANFNDGTVSGIQVDAGTGQLKNPTNNVKTSGQTTCLVFSSRTY